MVRASASASLLTAALLGLAASLGAQAPPARVVVDLHLGGDSVQAAMTRLRRGEVYIVELVPRRAAVQFRLAAASRQPPLPTRPIDDWPPPEGGVVFALTPRRTGDYLVELTNPGVGAAHVVVLTTARGPEGAAGAAVASPAAAFEPEVTVLDETFPGPRSTVVLAAETVYRIEVSPPGAGASVAIRSARSSSGPPLLMYPGDAPTAAAAVFTILPTGTDEYRVDVATGGDPVRLRIIRDPKETARWIRIGELTRDRPRAGIGVRAVVIGAFATPAGGASDSARAGGVGFDACLGVVPRGAWLGGPIGGCALSMSYYDRGGRGGVIMFGLAPRLVLTRPNDPVQWSLSLSAGIGTTTAGQEQTYTMFGAGLVLERQLSGTPLTLEAETDAVLVRAMATGGVPRGPPSRLVPRLAFGLQYRL